MPSPILHVRVDEEMVEEIDKLATQLGVDRSVTVRSLLAAALHEPAKRAATREVVMLLSQQRKLILARFNDVLQAAVDDLATSLGRDS